ncbi:ThuA domain-containing protein [Danxiaibacter flavus]|uniref:ThuA domain-containing protein n=1 Tax=Danxiaibacter flavus TaxID=3049108 RepID=A0ABV3Z9N2_9BACT|nr:ThuA domain-containing protein [Chitinophagaceae bacterium DXS]
MKNILRFSFAILVVSALLLGCSQKRSGNPRILVFTKTAGFHHSSIPAGVKAIQQLAAENKFDVDTTSDAEMFTEDTLKKYSAVVFLSTTGNLLTSYQEADFERYIQAGGGYVGIHAASDAEYDWGWYGRLVGGYFDSHPAQQEAVIKVVDANNEATKHLPATWKRLDEWYNFKKLNPDVHVLLAIDEKSYQGGTNGDNHPMAWYHDYDGGRAWYTELGHTDESYSDPNYLKHILAGIKYAIGENKNLDYAKAKSLRVPEEDRFTKVQLVQGTFFEPTELTVLPNLDILVSQRRGEVLLYKNDTKTVKQAGFLNVYYKTVHTPGVNAEEGLLGIQKDPDFAKNHFIYLYYSPVDTSVNRLSRFTLNNDTIDPKSEKVILQLYSQREICCHTGGSIAFGKNRELFVSTGDNSTPFDEPNQKYVSHGYAPLDDRPGHQQYDVRRSSGNTNDLRGKILRIIVNEDGTYSIPEGNLFPKDEKKARPEIYVMGDRNPYRISVDPKNNYLYWGEVGPDANTDSLDTRGPRGYDEVNQARKAGYFGWPLFIGNNYPYHAYDYATGTTGAAFDPKKPINNSKNNTGLTELPPAQPAFIWYPYGESKEFPSLGSGGRTAMAGPVYYSDLYPKETRFPDYYNGKFFFYEWIRGFIKPVTMLPNGDFDKMESFMPDTKFNAPIDMDLGPDGRLYILEYGNGWFTKNADAGLVRIDYNGGNRAPKIAGITVDKTSGTLPLTVNIAVEAKDPERDALTYIWTLGDGTTKETKEPSLKYTFNKAGDYNISVDVKDDKNATSKSDIVNVYAGNEAPTVNVAVEGNQTFYFPGTPVKYAVAIEDKDDTAKVKDPADLVVTANYIEGSDKAAMPQGHQVMSAAANGKNLMLSFDCKACHKVDEKSIGPAFTAVSQKYAKNPNAMAYLTNKITKGGGGVWGETAMSAHPDIKEGDLKQIVSWILSLEANKNVKSLPASGSVSPTMNQPLKDRGILYISATYTDKGGANIKPLSGSATTELRNSKMTFGRIQKMQDFSKNFFNGTAYMLVPKTTGWFAVEDIDLTGIKQAALTLGWLTQPVGAFTFELHLDAPDGKKLGELTFNGAAGKDESKKPKSQVVSAKVEPVTDGKKHTVYVVSKAKDASGGNNMLALSSLELMNK